MASQVFILGGELKGQVILSGLALDVWSHPGNHNALELATYSIVGVSSPI